MDNFNEITTVEYLSGKPETFWFIVLTGAVCVVGVVDFVKCWFKNKKSAVKWIVFIISLAIAIILSPLVPPIATGIIILWLAILAVATIARNAVVDGLPAMIAKIMGAQKKEEK